MSNEYDFYAMGIRYAEERLIDLKEKADNIGKDYGINAKMEFEAGICSAIPVFSSVMSEPVSDKEVENATNQYGVAGKMNLSYLDGIGTGNQILSNEHNETPSTKSR